MKLCVGETYNFFKNNKDWWIIKVVEIQEDRYWVDVIKRVGDQQYMVGHRSWISFKSVMFHTYEITKYHKADISEDFDPEIDELISHVQKRFILDKLHQQIDEALAFGNKELFIQLTNKLKGVAV